MRMKRSACGRGAQVHSLYDLIQIQHDALLLRKGKQMWRLVRDGARAATRSPSGSPSGAGTEALITASMSTMSSSSDSSLCSGPASCSSMSKIADISVWWSVASLFGNTGAGQDHSRVARDVNISDMTREPAGRTASTSGARQIARRSYALETRSWSATRFAERNERRTPPASVAPTALEGERGRSSQSRRASPPPPPVGGHAADSNRAFSNVSN